MDEVSDPSTPGSETPLQLNDHHLNFWAFLGYCQKLDVPLLPMSWHPGLGDIGRGGQGQVQESFYRRTFGWAYKRFKPSRILLEMRQFNTPYSQRRVLRELRGIYRAGIAEIKALTKPEIRECPYVVDLEGVAWEMLLPEIYIPVLIFERSLIGSLKEFIISARASNSTFATRYELCENIAIGLYWLHVNGIVHGDISPDNILVFESLDKPNPYHARISDFGCSTCITTPLDQIKVAVKYPWTAPEVHHRGLPVHDAMKSDIYSFTLLVLWSLFSEELGEQGRKREPGSQIPGQLRDQAPGLFQYNSSLDSIGRAKARGCLSSTANELIEQKVTLFPSTKILLRNFFYKNLNPDVQVRAQDMTTLLVDLKIDMNKESWQVKQTELVKDEPLLEENRTIHRQEINLLHLLNFHPEFQLVASIEDLVTYPDPLFHSSFIAQCKMVYEQSNMECARCSLYIALAMAVAYSLGFGAPRDSELAHSWAEKEGIPFELVSMSIDLLKNHSRAQKSFKNRELNLDANIGYINAPIPHTLQEIEVTAQGLERELVDMAYTLGSDHFLIAILRERITALMRHDIHSSSTLENVMLRVYYGQGNPWRNQTELIQKILHEPIEADVHDVIRILSAAAAEEWGRGNYAAGKKLAILADQVCKKLPIASLGPIRIRVLNLIAYTCYGHGIRHEWLRAQEAIARKVLKMAEKFHGRYNLEILQHIQPLGLILMRQHEYEEAERLSSRGYNIARSILGLDNVVTFSFMIRHVDVLIERGKFDEAEYVIVSFLHKARTPREANLSLFYLVEQNLGIIYYRQGRFHEALQQLEASIERFEHIDNVPVDKNTYQVIGTLIAVNAKLKNLDKVVSLFLKFIARKDSSMGGLRRVIRVQTEVAAVIIEADIGLTEQFAEALLGTLISAAQFCGIASPDTLECLEKLILAYEVLQQWHCTETMIRLLLAGLRLRDGKDWYKNIRALRLLVALAWAVSRQERHKEAIAIMKVFQSKIAKRNIRMECWPTWFMAELHALCGNYDIAETMLRSVIRRLTICTCHDDNLTKTHPLCMGLLCFLYLCRGKDLPARLLKTRLLGVLQDSTRECRLECIQAIISRVSFYKGAHLPKPALSFLNTLIDFHIAASGKICINTMHLLTHAALMKQINGNIHECVRELNRILGLIPDVDASNLEKARLRFRTTSYIAWQKILLGVGCHDEVNILSHQALEAQEAEETYEDLEIDQNKLPEDDMRTGLPTSSSHFRVAWHHANLGDWIAAADLFNRHREVDASATDSPHASQKSEEIAFDMAKVLVQTNEPDWEWLFRTHGFRSIWETRKRQKIDAKLASWLSHVQKLCRLGKLAMDRVAKGSLSRDGLRKALAPPIAGRWYYRRGIARVRRRNGQPFFRKLYSDNKEMVHYVETFNRQSLASWRRTGWQGTWPRH
ncbi:hypothetical protein F4678DRAFT_447808 [Xylaria arbuscula]|nr:hypothetical protein F4678DRAFT_447808 [Xylaria arbuscula]